MNDKILGHAYERLERNKNKNFSQQPRLSNKANESPNFFSSVLRWVTAAKDEEPEYKADSRTRDTWLSSFWPREPHWAGVVSSVNMIDSNRGWNMIGGRNQVMRFVPVLRDADDGAGWRQWISQQSTGFYTSDMGPITELGRDGDAGPVRALYHVDPTKCMLTGNRKRPLKYDNTKNPWKPEDFFRLVSMKNIREEFNGLGISATTRVLDMAKLMLGIYGHEMEMIGARAPKGLLLLQNVSQEQWDQAMRVRDASLDSDMRRYYNAVAVIAQQGVDSIDAKLVALSQLPQGFDLEVFTNLLMYTYALCIGYDPIEFWPVQAGQLGRGRETDIQHRKGTGKGGLNFMLAMQEALQKELPDTVHFEFEQRDQEGVLLDVKVAQEAANLVTTLYSGKGAQVPGPRGESGGDGEAPRTELRELESLITREEARSLLVKWGVFPDSWTQSEEEAKATDAKEIERLKHEELMENDTVRRAIFQYPTEPIIQYSWSVYGEKTRVLFRRGEDAQKATRFSLVKPIALIPDFSRDEDTEQVQLPDSPILPLPVDSFRVENGLNMYQGETPPLMITVKNKKGEEIDVSSSLEIIYFISKTINDKPFLIKEIGRGVRVDRSNIHIDFDPEDTKNLHGRYFHRIKILDDLGRSFTVFQGEMAVLKGYLDA